MQMRVPNIEHYIIFSKNMVTYVFRLELPL